MKILLYSHKRNQTEDRIAALLEERHLKNNLEIHRGIETLSQQLMAPTSAGAILMLLVADPKDLKNLLTARDHFADHKIILILPDRRAETVSTGHQLYPRFLSCVDDDLSQMGAVLTKMIAH